MSEVYEIDFYKELRLPQPMTCGLVNKVLSPKGKRKLNDRDQYEYHLNDELIQVYQGTPAQVTEGLYWVMDVFRRADGQLQWNHYLVVVDDEGFYPIYEYLEAHDTTWIVDAMPYIKGYFAGEEFDPIELTKYKMPKPKTKWSKIR